MNRAILISAIGLALALASCAPGDPDGPSALSRSMDTIDAARSLLDQQPNLAIWYAEYDGPEESIRYANALFSETFGIPLHEILEKKRYHLVNPPDTPAEVIARYKNEDREAIELGHFLHRGPFAEAKDIVVLKLRFDNGMLGLFKIVESGEHGAPISLRDLDADFLALLQKVRPDLLD